jgi:hypothetical protein
MGAFYSSVTVFGTGLEKIDQVCDRPAFIVADTDMTVVFSEADDEGGGDLPEGALSAALEAVTLSVMVHDSDLLALFVHRNGELIVQGCVPDPDEYFGTEPGEGPEALSGTVLVSALGRGDAAALDAALVNDVTFAEDRHAAVLQALGLRTWSVGFGYRYIDADPAAFAGPTPVRLD